MPRKKTKFLFSDESEEEAQEEDDEVDEWYSRDNFSSKHRKRCEFRDSDTEDDGDGGDEDSSQNSSSGKGKKKRGIITSDSEGSSGDDNGIFKSKSRRGIIDSEEDGSEDDATDESGSSGDEEEENAEETENLCPICLGDFEEQMLGIPENCQHIFCMDCIKEWSKNVNNCPVDRKKFNLITIKDKDGKFIKEVVVEDPKKNEAEFEDPPTYCQVCRECNREDCMLLCDECDNGYHMDCLTPPLDYVPIEEWFCTECAPPPKAASSSPLSRRQRQDSQYIGEESTVEEIYNRNELNSAAPPAKRPHLMFGQSSSTTTRQARTVASTKRSRARSRRGRGRGRASTAPRRVSKRKKKGKRKAKEKETNPDVRTSSRVKAMNQKKQIEKAKKELIDSELQKVREKIIQDTDNRFCLYGNPFDLDELFDPGDELGIRRSPLRSTIVDTPDVVGSILGGFDTLNPNKVIVSRDGRGTLTKKSEIVEKKKEPLPSTSKKRKIKFSEDSDNDDNDSNSIGTNHDSAKNVPVEKISEEDAEEAERCLQDNIKRRTLKFTDSEEKKQEGKATLIDNMRKRLKASIEKKAKEEEQRKECNRMREASQKKAKEEEVRNECNKMREASERKAKEEEAKRKKIVSERKAKEEELRKECNRMKEESDKKAKEEELRKECNQVKAANEKKTKEEELQGQCNRMKIASEKKTKGGVQDDCSPKKTSNEITYRSSSTLPTSTATFKIPKLKKKPVVAEEAGSVSAVNNSLEKSAEKDSSFKEDVVVKNQFKKGDVHTKNNVEKNPKKDCHVNNDFKKEESLVVNDLKKEDVPTKRDSSKINVSPNCHREGSQKKITVDALKKETEVIKDSKKRPPLTSLEKKMKLYNMGKLKPEIKKQKHDKKYSIEKKYSTCNSSSYKRTHGNESSSSCKHPRESESNSPCKQNYENLSVYRKAKYQEEESKKKSISLEAYRNRRLYDDVFGDSDVETTKKDSQHRPCEKTKHNELRNSNQSIKKDHNSVKDPRLRVVSVDNKSCVVSNSVTASKLDTTRPHPSSTISQSHSSNINSQSEKVSKLKNPVTSTFVQDVYSKYLNPSTKTYNDASISPSKKHTEKKLSVNSDSPKPVSSRSFDSPGIYNTSTTKPSPAKDTSQRDKINSKSSEHYKHISENQGNKSSYVNKFDENSPYSVIRPFLQGSNSSSSNTPVAVVSPSLRDGVSESSFKFKDTKTSVNTASLQVNSICLDPRLQRSANSSLRNNNADNTNDLKNVYSDKSGVTGIATDNIEKKSINIASTHLKEQLKKDLQYNPLKKVDGGETEFIDKIKSYLKPYYKRGLLTKDQWKVVVKTSVKTIQTHRTYFASDDRRIEMLVQKHMQPFLIVKNVL